MRLQPSSIGSRCSHPAGLQFYKQLTSLGAHERWTALPLPGPRTRATHRCRLLSSFLLHGAHLNLTPQPSAVCLSSCLRGVFSGARRRAETTVPGSGQHPTKTSCLENYPQRKGLQPASPTPPALSLEVTGGGQPSGAFSDCLCAGGGGGLLEAAAGRPEPGLSVADVGMKPPYPRPALLCFLAMF